MSQDPYTDYGNQPQKPYQYGTPQNPYEAPQGPYATPAPYGYGQQQQGYGYPPPQPTPLPLDQAIKQLPSQYLKVLTKPSAYTFAQEMNKARWDIVWAQLIGYAVIAAILSYISTLTVPNLFNLTGTITLDSVIIQAIRWGLTLGLIPLTIIGFFIGTGISYLIAKAFGGRGTFLAQGYTRLLFEVPLGILIGLVSLVPFLGGFAAFGAGIYTIVLNIFSIMAVHRLSGGKATAVVLIPVAVAILLVLISIAVIIGTIVAAGNY